MEDNEMVNDIDVETDHAESSKDALRRIRRLAISSSTLGGCPKSALHPHTSSLVFPFPSNAQSQSSNTNINTDSSTGRGGHLSIPLFSPLSNNILPVPDYNSNSNIPLGIGLPTAGQTREYSLSPSGKWSIIFHPDVPSESGREGGGTLIISRYNKSQPHFQYRLNSSIRAMTHLYPPRIHLPTKRGDPLGPRPRPSTSMTEDNGPSFVLLTQREILYFYPILDISISARWTMDILKVSLSTRTHSITMTTTTGQQLPVTMTMSMKQPERERDIVKRGWMGLIPNNEGVWISYESLEDDEIRVLVLNIGIDKSGRNFIQSNPLPLLPRSKVDKELHTILQGVVFIDLPTSTEQVDSNSYSNAIVEKVGAAFIYRDTTDISSRETIAQTRIVVHSFQRREIELADGFTHISSGTTSDTNPMWDWLVVPKPIGTITSPSQTTIIAISALLAIEPPTFIALMSTNNGIALSHLELTSENWVERQLVDVETLDLNDNYEIVPSQSVVRGLKGIVAWIGEKSGVTLVVVPRARGQEVLGEKIEDDLSIESSAAEAATGILLAEKQGVDWSDVVQAAIGPTPRADRKELPASIFRRIYSLASEQVGIDEFELLLRVQVAFLSATSDRKLELANDVLRLQAVCNLVDECALLDDEISFYLDSIWPLIGVFDWAIGVVASSMREIVLLGAKIDWHVEEDVDLNEYPSIILLLHPKLRSIVLRLLSQLNSLSNYLDNLQRPILQPESRYLPPPLRRDPMATIVARERIRDLAYHQGVDSRQWGRVLEHLSSTVDDQSLLTSLLNLDNTPLQPILNDLLSSLPTTSTLFEHPTSSSQTQLYDGITFSPISIAETKGGKQCVRCRWRTIAQSEFGHGNGSGAKSTSPWELWKMQWEDNCVCGGSWVSRS